METAEPAEQHSSLAYIFFNGRLISEMPAHLAARDKSCDSETPAEQAKLSDISKRQLHGKLTIYGYLANSNTQYTTQCCAVVCVGILTA